MFLVAFFKTLNVGLIFSYIIKLIPRFIPRDEMLFKGRPEAEKLPSEDPGGDRTEGATL